MIILNIPTRIKTATAHMGVVALALTAVGCGGASVRYAPPADEKYDQLPLMRPKSAETFAVVTTGKPLTNTQISIEGMRKVDAGAPSDMTVTIDYQGTDLIADGPVHSGYVCVSAPVTGPDGQQIDGSMAKYYQPLGFNEPITRGPLHLIVGYWQNGTLTRNGSFTVKSADGKALSNGPLGASGAVLVGKVLHEQYPFRQVMSIASASGGVGSGVHAQGPHDAAASAADDYMANAYVDYTYVSTSNYIPQSKVEAAMAQMASKQGSPGRTSLATAWNQEVQNASQSTTGVLGAVQAHLNANYASGPRTIKLLFAEVDGEHPAASGVTQAGTIVSALMAQPVAQRSAQAQQAIQLLESAKSQTKPEEIRLRAALSYDIGLVKYLAGDFTAAAQTLDAATTENAQEKDGMFGSSGRELAGVIQPVLASAKDRALRLQASLAQ